jgi:hypothetical protein
MLVSGVSGAGKTVWVIKLIKHLKDVADTDIQQIVYCYSEYQKCYEELAQRGVKFIQGIPTENDMHMFSSSKPSLMVIDDLMGDISQIVCDLFTKYSHHKNISVVYLVQNLFPKDKFSRTVSLNSNIIVLFANTRDKTQVSVLARQIFPGESKNLIDAYKDATSSTPHGYLLIDLQKETPDKLRLRTNIYPGEGLQYVYVKRK